ncbi:MAG TPA: TonB family protein, partial [Gemmatimonadaceae bacterium]|nr:TonB family protein [Gemmatimonadaceae bacterium]
MLYAAAVGGLVTLAAAAIDRVAVTRGRPLRFVWLAAILATLGWPAAHAIEQSIPRSDPTSVMPFTIVLQPMVAASVSGPDRAALLDRALVALWIVATAVLLLRLTSGIVSLGRIRARWREGDVDGTRVRLSPNVGPAVVGLHAMDVVLPEWIMSLDPPLRALVLRHEEEHRNARDPYLLCAAGIAVALMPWNPALWLQARRLRLAIEMDCDGRVLRAYPSPERYGMLMLAIAQRRSVAPAMFAPMLTEPTTQLEERIIAMRATTHRLTRLTLYGGLTIAAAALFVACALESDSPTGPRPSSGPTRIADDGPYFEYQVEQPVTAARGDVGLALSAAGGLLGAPRYPDVLRSAHVQGEVLAQFVVDTTGRAEMSTFKVLRSSHDLFTAAVLDGLPAMRFMPARVGGRAVRQIVQMPFQFRLASNEVRTLGTVRVTATATATRGEARRSSNASAAGGGAAAPARATPTVDRQSNAVQAKAAAAAATQPTVVDSSLAFREFQVEHPAQPLAGNHAPRYPDVLRSAGVEGEVLATFVVDRDGRPESSSFKVLKSTHGLFSAA